MTLAAAGRSPSGFGLWAPVVAYMALIFGLSAMSAPPAPPQVNDKLEHFFAYGGLALLALRATTRARWASLSWTTAGVAWAIAAAYGVSDEVHQAFVPGRTPDAADVLADALGAAVALIVAGAFGIIRRSRHPADAA